jgi:hypothetical protein
MKLTKKYWACFLLLMCLVNGIVYIVFFVAEKNDKLSISENLVLLTEEIHADSNVTSKFSGAGGVLEAIEVFFSTHNRDNKGNVTVEILCGEEQICRYTADMAKLPDNQYFRWTMDAGKRLSAEKEYTVSLSSDTMGGSVSGWTDENGALVANIYISQTPSLGQIVAVNIMYAVINYIFCLLICSLRKKG